MIRIRTPAIREIKGDKETPATINVDIGIFMGQSPESVEALIIEASQGSKTDSGPPSVVQGGETGQSRIFAFQPGFEF
jgi:hypothetical protein